LAEVEPGDSGYVDFEFNTLGLIGSNLSILQDPQVEADLSISAKQPAQGNILQEINNFDKKIIKVNTNLQITGQALYHSGAFQNTGPLPPQAGSETTYTIVWTVTNSANAVSGAEVRAALSPFNVRFIGPISPVAENLTYNDATKEIIWNLGSVARAIGFGSDPRQVSFQVGLTPSSSQAGSSPVLVGAASLTGLDTFTNSTVGGQKGQINTQLSNDPGFTPDQGKVAE
jgi:hypothetical protein